MFVILVYDVEQSRTQKMLKKCREYLYWVQNSVFECLLDPAQFAIFKFALAGLIDPKKDSLRFYLLGANWKRRVEHIGAKPSYDPEGVLIT